MVYKQKHPFCTKVLIRRGMQQDIFICKFFIFIIYISMRTILGLQVLSKARGNSIRFQVIYSKISTVVNNLFNIVHIKQFCCVLCVMWSMLGVRKGLLEWSGLLGAFLVWLVGGGEGQFVLVCISVLVFCFFFLGWLFIKKIMFGNT